MRKSPPDQFRVQSAGFWSSSYGDGFNGAFSIPLPGFGHKVIANCIVSDGLCDVEEISGWEHVSVHIVEYGKQRIATWAEMCAVKDIFWEDEECVVQFHPPKSEYVNNHPFVLHLWKQVKSDMARPHHLTVGIKGLGQIT
jgi:hypothetical protein